MPDKTDLLNKLFSEKFPKNFTVRDLDNLMNKCDYFPDSTAGGALAWDVIIMPTAHTAV